MADFLKECMSDVSGKLGKVVPIDEFNQAFCVLCVNKECARSRSNNMLFDRRAHNWREELFINVPRAGDDDPQYSGIRSKKFISITIPTPTPNISQSTPEEPKVNPIEQKLNIEFKSEDPELSEKPEPEPVPELEISKPEPKPEPQVGPEPKPVKPNLGNTPFQQGTVLSGKSEAIQLEPGQSYTFGSDDETS
jgi:hypothetical protein